MNLSNQHAKNVKQNENPKHGVKFKTPTIENPYSILTDESDDDESRVTDDETLDHILSDNFRTGNDQYLIPDTGATTTCVTLNTKLKNEKKVNANEGMRVQLCTGTVTTAVATGELLLKNLPTAARKANKMNVTLPLLSIGKVCDTNCTAVFRKDDMLIANDNDINIQLLDEPLVTGPRDRNRTGLWKIPIPKSECATPPIWTKEMALSAYNQKTEEDLTIYLHGCAGYPVIETWIESIRAGR